MCIRGVLSRFNGSVTAIFCFLSPSLGIEMVILGGTATSELQRVVERGKEAIDSELFQLEF